jgi:hypothetical protein
MSEEKNDKQDEMDQKADEYQSKFGKCVRVFIAESGETHFFRRPTRAEITHFNKVARAQQDMAVEHSIGLCRSCHCGPGPKGDSKLEQSFNDYPLAYAGTADFDGVSDALIRLATGEAAITVK